MEARGRTPDEVKHDAYKGYLGEYHLALVEDRLEELARRWRICDRSDDGTDTDDGRRVKTIVVGSALVIDSDPRHCDKDDGAMYVIEEWDPKHHRIRTLGTCRSSDFGWHRLPSVSGDGAVVWACSVEAVSA